MPIVLVRVDDRLIHGQVVMGWVPHLQAREVVVVAEAAAADETQKALMQMAMPEGVQLRVLGVAEAVRQLREPEEARRILVLVPSPQEALKLLEGGLDFTRLNVGGLHYTAGRVQLGKAIFLNPQDQEALRELARRGVVLEGRALPGDVPIDRQVLLGAAP